ncbi:NusB antitermination factor [Actinopolyspora xinjiangensis]|uniref:Transcription antitermination protein NusB n=1 Tax=Actinopolyspora xinjiangensis TaxID=405564 RepID=A0A1H0TV67_9ACTN|nr:transcription antitermination factor NusB [Actinopolyspora xinjiangensis]SDP57645.1 NusB antitermination factor [Actinopolyspora xinjiangensis]
MGARSKARERAVEVLYEADLRELPPDTLLRERVGSTEAPAVGEYTITLVSGVAEHRERIDELIVEYSQGWALSRMPVVDRAVLRLGFFELLWEDDIPPAVVIDEAVQLGKALSTDDTPRFVNGVLGRLAGIDERQRKSLRSSGERSDAGDQDAAPDEGSPTASER